MLWAVLALMGVDFLPRAGDSGCVNGTYEEEEDEKKVSTHEELSYASII